MTPGTLEAVRPEIIIRSFAVRSKGRSGKGMSRIRQVVKTGANQRAFQAFLAKHPEVVAEDFSGYMAGLNPDESVWGRTKYGRLSKLAAWNAEELRARVRGRSDRLEVSTTTVTSFYWLCGNTRGRIGCLFSCGTQ
jgi:hypothetical protein